MLPGRTFTPEDIVEILRRRIWLLLVPLAAASATGAVIARALPDTYRAQALVAVVPQQVPSNFVPSTITARLNDRLQSIQNTVLSRPRLEKLILDLNLYPEERRTGIMEDIVQRMKARDLRIMPNGNVAFRVIYQGREPVSTMRVAQEIASAFINESLIDRARLTDQTSEFMESAAESARLRLVDLEQQVVQYRLRHAGELPTQLDSNVRALGNVQSQIQSIAQSRNNARERRLLLERQLITARETPAAALPLPTDAARGRGGPPPTPTLQKLADAQRQLDLVSAQYTPIHPDVKRWEAEVQALKQKVAEEAAAGGVPGPTQSPAELYREQQIQELEKQLDELDRQLAQYDAEEARLQEQVALYRSRIDAAPVRDAELTELLRNYDELKASHSELVRKAEAARLAASLERREIGEQFQLLEPATVPQRPFSPNRQRITLFGLLAGLALGVGLIGLIEYRDNSFKTDKQVVALLGLPVLAVVPLMQSDQERRRTRLWRMAMHVGLGSTVAGCLAVLAYAFLG